MGNHRCVPKPPFRTPRTWVPCLLSGSLHTPEPTHLICPPPRIGGFLRAESWAWLPLLPGTGGQAGSVLPTGAHLQALPQRLRPGMGGGSSPRMRVSPCAPGCFNRAALLPGLWGPRGAGSAARLQQSQVRGQLRPAPGSARRGACISPGPLAPQTVGPVVTVTRTQRLFLPRVPVKKTKQIRHTQQPLMTMIESKVVLRPPEPRRSQHGPFLKPPRKRAQARALLQRRDRAVQKCDTHQGDGHEGVGVLLSLLLWGIST